MNTIKTKGLEELFTKLAGSKFRNSFKLKTKELRYLREKGFDTIKKHAYEFVTARLALAIPENDGKQTPMKNHPVFIAQHATATCCRGCLQKWHGIKKGNKLTTKQIIYIVSVIMHWLHNEMDYQDMNNIQKQEALI